MMEVFEAFAVIGDAVTEEDQVVYLLASLPALYDVLITALEAQSETVPKWELITERLRHEEQKQKEKMPTDSRQKAFIAKQKRGDQKKQFTCHYRKKPGHLKRNCRKFLATQQGEKKQTASTAETKDPSPNLESDGEVLVTTHARSAASSENWIVDSGATCHMCNDEIFSEFRSLETPQKVTLGNGHALRATAEGTVTLETLLPDGSTKKCRLEYVLLVPKLSHSLLSVLKASEAGKTTRFESSGCEIVNKDNKVIAFATGIRNLYYLEYCRKSQRVNVTEKSKERLWHRRFEHISEQKLQRMAKDELVGQLYNTSKGIVFCETCIGGKHR